MKTAISRLLLFLFLFGLALPAAAQTSSEKALAQMPLGTRQLIAIKVTGSKRYSEAAIAAATGLQIGVPVTDDDFKKAARRLGDMGVFTEVAYTFSYSFAGTKLELHVIDGEKFVPARFEDFVWFTDDELRSRIKEHVPLFNGELPLSGRLADEVSDVLQAMLVQNAISGHVEYARTGKPDQPVDAIRYSVSDVLIRVRKIEFTGAGEAEIPALEEAAQRLPERQYSQSRLNLLAQNQLIPVYYSRGYLKAVFSQPQPRVVKPSSGKSSSDENEDAPRNQTVVDVTFAVTPGVQYKLKSLEWSGNHEFPTGTLQKMVRADLGKPANTVHLTENLKDVQKLYAARGFITATIVANAEFDDVASTVVLRLEVKEGPVYHMGELEFRGLDNSLMARLRDAWKLRFGEIYNADYLDEYLPAARKLLPANFDWECTPHVTANVRDKTVDVDLIYSVRAAK